LALTARRPQYAIGAAAVARRRRASGARARRPVRRWTHGVGGGGRRRERPEEAVEPEEPSNPSIPPVRRGFARPRPASPDPGALGPGRSRGWNHEYLCGAWQYRGRWADSSVGGWNQLRRCRTAASPTVSA